MRDLDNTILQAARARGCLLSFSSVSKWQRCPLSWKFSYIDKILTPPNRAMLMGTLFDEQCESGGNALFSDYADKGLTIGDYHMVNKRYEAYKHHISDTDVQQMLVYAPISASSRCSSLANVWVDEAPPIYLHGYVDRVKYIPDENGVKYLDNPILPIDYKFTQKPVNGKAKDHWKQQARYYLWLLQQMGYDVDRFEFHVCNAVDDTIDIIKYKPRQNTVDRVPTEVMAAYEGMQSEWYPPNIDRHCTWCDHEQRCQNFTSRRLDNGTE